MIALVQFFLCQLICPCKLVFCSQDVTEEKKIGKGEKTYVKQLTVLEVSNKQPEGNNVKEEIKKKKKNAGKK